VLAPHLAFDVVGQAVNAQRAPELKQIIVRGFHMQTPVVRQRCSSPTADATQALFLLFLKHINGLWENFDLDQTMGIGAVTPGFAPASGRVR
jgi:hypothetical protein